MKKKLYPFTADRVINRSNFIIAVIRYFDEKMIKKMGGEIIPMNEIFTDTGDALYTATVIATEELYNAQELVTISMPAVYEPPNGHCCNQDDRFIINCEGKPFAEVYLLNLEERMFPEYDIVRTRNLNRLYDIKDLYLASVLNNKDEEKEENYV